MQLLRLRPEFSKISQFPEFSIVYSKYLFEFESNEPVRLALHSYGLTDGIHIYRHSTYLQCCNSSLAVGWCRTASGSQHAVKLSTRNCCLGGITATHLKTRTPDSKSSPKMQVPIAGLLLPTQSACMCLQTVSIWLSMSIAPRPRSVNVLEIFGLAEAHQLSIDIDIWHCLLSSLLFQHSMQRCPFRDLINLQNQHPEHHTHTPSWLFPLPSKKKEQRHCKMCPQLLSPIHHCSGPW